jgi:hypothetical protein
MVLFPLAAWLFISIPEMPFHKSVVFFEFVGIYVFATYWVFKRSEASKTNLDEKATRGKLIVPPHGLRNVLRPLSNR